MKHFPEVMSPAGDFICLDAALGAGADAIYFGLNGLNMRANAGNFERGDMRKIARLCAARGAKAYLVLNTIYFDRDIPNLKKALSSAAKAGINAVIAWDFSVLKLAREVGIEVFLSTQASVSNADAIAEYFLRFGIKRFVLARECEISDIAKIRTRLRKILGAKTAELIQIEVFVHGAMCVSVSGRCFMSQFLYGKSANRGECLQPCRRSYHLVDAERPDSSRLEIANHCVMSPKDLCALPFIEKLFDVGVDSLKIEGRNRNAQYVDATTRAYVTARDFYIKNKSSKNFVEKFSALKAELLSGLEAVFNRGFSDGFYMGKPIGNWTSAGNEAKSKKVVVGRVTNFFSKKSIAEIRVDDKSFSVGDKLEIEGSSTGYFNFVVEEMRASAGGEIRVAQKGASVSLPIPRKVRKGDRVYMLVPLRA